MDNNSTYKSQLYLTRGTEIISFCPPSKSSTEVQVPTNTGVVYSSPYNGTPGFMATAFMRFPPSAFSFPSPDAGGAAHAAVLPLQESLLPLQPIFSSSLFPPFCWSGLPRLYPKLASLPSNI